AGRSFTVHFDPQAHKYLRHSDHGGDAILERHACAQVNQVAIVLVNLDGMLRHAPQFVAQLGQCQKAKVQGNCWPCNHRFLVEEFPAMYKLSKLWTMATKTRSATVSGSKRGSSTATIR